MRRLHQPSLRRSAVGLLMAVLALLGQIASVTLTPAQAAAGQSDLLTPTLAASPICHSGTAEDGAPAGHTHHGLPCALCPACHALAAAAVLPVPTAAIPAPAAGAVARPARLPLARGPPTAAVLAATYPTGPPRLA